MMWPWLALLLVLTAGPAASADLSVSGTRFVIATRDGAVLRSEQLIGAVFDMVTPDGTPARVRIDGVAPADENAAILLHDLKVEGQDGEWRPMCQPDAYGRSAGFPLAGRWQGERFIADMTSWFVTCASGSRGKCVLWGFDPWGQSPDGRPLASLYQACQHMVRADYDGKGTAHTRNGTIIDGWDIYDIEPPETADEPDFAFEAGWGPDGAVCVARTRWPSLLPLSILLESAPQLAATPCDEAEARRRGAVLFNRSKLRH